MRTSRICLAIALLTMTATAADPMPTDADRLKESLAKWEKARDAVGGDYVYVVRWSSAFGFGNITTVTVKTNKVVERKFEEFAQPQPGKAPEVKQKWLESGKDVGSHKNEGAAPRTVDEMYVEAQKLIEAKTPETHVRTLGFDKEGLLYYCFVRDRRILDDAPLVGVRPFQLQLPVKK